MYFHEYFNVYQLGLPFLSQNWWQNRNGKRLLQQRRGARWTTICNQQERTRTNQNDSKRLHCACAYIDVIRRGATTVLNISKHTLRLHKLWWSLRWATIKPGMMTSSNGNIFRVTGPLCGEFTGLRRIPRTKARDAGLWYFLWSAPN